MLRRGGMIFTFFKAEGLSVGKSLVEEDQVKLAKEIQETAKAKRVEFLLPVDVILADKFAEDAQTQIADVTAIPDGWMVRSSAERTVGVVFVILSSLSLKLPQPMAFEKAGLAVIQLCPAGGVHSRLSAALVLMEQGLDIGPKSVAEFQKALQGAKSVIWNGPMGVFEMKPFAKGTNAIAQTLAELTSEVCSWSLDLTPANGIRGYIMVPTTVIIQKQQLSRKVVASDETADRRTCRAQPQ